MTAISGITLHVALGGLTVDRCPRLTIESERGAPLSLGEMDLPDPGGDLFSRILPGTDVDVAFGYRGADSDTWPGRVAAVVRGAERDQVTVRMQSHADLQLLAVPVTEAWIDESPEAILRDAARAAGVAVAVLDPTGVVLPRFTAASLPLWALARQAEHTLAHAHGRDMAGWTCWMGADGLHWGDHDEPGDVPVIATGKGLIRHDPAVRGTSAWSELETFLLPGFMHSRQVHVEDIWRGVTGTFRALRVRHEIRPDKARTVIHYGAAHERL